MENLKTGDIILTSRDSLIVKLQRFFQKDPVRYGHAAIIDMETNSVLEASFKLKASPLEEFFANKKHKKYKILRYNNITDTQTKVLVKSMWSLIGNIYNFKRIFLQALDHIFNTNWFTKLDKNKNNQVCSSYVAWGYYVACKIKFNDVGWASCDPDDIEDNSLKYPDKWTVIEEAT